VKVKEGFEGFKRRFQEKEQRMKLCSDSQERLRWTEGIMALLLRLDQLQGVHPEVRLIRKAAAKELLVFQENLDSMSNAPGEENVEDGNVAEEENVGDDSVAEEKSEACDAAEEGAEVTEPTNGDMDIPAAEPEEKMEVENMEDVETTQAEAADGTTAAAAAADDDEHQEAMEQDSAPAEEGNEREHDSDNTTVADEAVTAAVTNCDDQGSSPSDTIDESMVEDAERDGLELGFARAPAEVPMDVENEVAPACDVEEEGEVKADVPQTVPDVDLEGGDQESSGVVDDSSPADIVGEPVLKEAELGDSAVKDEQSHSVGGGDDTEKVTNETEGPELEDAGDDALALACISLEERATDAGDGWMVPASSAKSLQVGQPQISDSLSDRALLEQLLEENRKLKDAVGKVLHWGKQQNDIIHSLASRIEQLEEQQPRVELLQGEKMNGRKRICSDGGVVGDRERSRRSKGRRKGRQGNRPQLGYLDSERLSAESDEYF
jgi:hypothetical protein